MLKFRLISLLLALTMLLALGACASNAQQPGTPAPTPPAADTADAGDDPTQGETIVITVSEEGSANLPHIQAAVWAMERIEEETGGRISFNFFADGVLGTGAETLQQMIDGTIEMSMVSVGVSSAYSPNLQALQLPFLLNDYDVLRAALATPEFQALIAPLEEFGIKSLGVTEVGMRHFAHVNHPVNTVDDLSGDRLRIVPSAMLQDAISALGANPVLLPFGEVYTALQNNLVDALEINLVSMMTMRFYEVTNYFSFVGLYPFPTVYAINLDFFNSLSAQDQEILQRWFSAAVDRTFEVYIPAVEEQAIQTMLAAGIEFNTIEDVEPFIDLVLPIHEEFAAQDPVIRDFVDIAIALRS